MAENQPKRQEKPEQREWRMKKGLDAFGNMFGLNVCFVVASLPVFTIGASLTATYAMAIRLQEDEEETIVHGFIHEFKRNFKQATIAWLIVLVAAAILVAENLLVNNAKTLVEDASMANFISVFYTIVFYLELLMVGLVLAFLFPMIGRYTTTVKQAFKNSLLLSVGYVWSAIKIIVAWAAPIVLSVIYPMIFLYTWYLWLLLLFGAIVWGTTHTVRYVFRKNEEALENTREAKEAEKREKQKNAAKLPGGKKADDTAGGIEAEEAEKDVEAAKKELPPKRELKGVAAKANVLKNSSGQASSGKSTSGGNNAGWYRGDKYDKNRASVGNAGNAGKNGKNNRNTNSGKNGNTGGKKNVNNQKNSNPQRNSSAPRVQNKGNKSGGNKGNKNSGK